MFVEDWHRWSPVFGTFVALPVFGTFVTLPVYGTFVALPVFGTFVVLPVFGTFVALPVFGTFVVLPVFGTFVALTFSVLTLSVSPHRVCCFAKCAALTSSRTAQAAAGTMNRQTD